MAAGVKLRRVSEAITAIKQIAPELVELLDKNFWDIETALTSVGAVSGTPGGGSGGAPGSNIHHGDLLDLTAPFDHHTQYLLLAGRVGGMDITQPDINSPLSYLGLSGGTDPDIDLIRFLHGVSTRFSISQDNVVHIGFSNPPRPAGLSGIALWGTVNLLRSPSDLSPWFELIEDDVSNTLWIRGHSSSPSSIDVGMRLFSISAGRDFDLSVEGTLNVIPNTDTLPGRFSRKAAHTGHILDFGVGTDPPLSYIDNNGAFVGPLTPTTARLPWGNDTTANGVSYSAASKDLTSSFAFSSVVVGMGVHGPDIPGGAYVVSKTSSSLITISVFPTGTQVSAKVRFHRGYEIYPLTASNRGFQLFTDSPVDGFTLATINQTLPNPSDVITIPILEVTNIFTHGQKIQASASERGLWIIPTAVEAIFIDDGLGGAAWYVQGMQAISGAPDIWYASGIGVTPKLEHNLLLTTDRLVNWPDITGTVVVSPPALEIVNTSANVSGGVLHGNTGSNKYFRVSIELITNTAGDRTVQFKLIWTNGVSRTFTTPSFALGANGRTSFIQFIFVTGGNLTYDLTFLGTTGTADVRVVVERMS